MLLTSFMRSMVEVIEGHFNPLKRPDRTVYSCRLSEKVQLDQDERGNGRLSAERSRQPRVRGGLSHPISLKSSCQGRAGIIRMQWRRGKYTA